VATTYATIRDRQIAVIEALTPALTSAAKFRRHRGEVEFTAWVEANMAACWRRFEILNSFNLAADGLTNAGDGNALWQFEHDEVLVVAYPRQFGKYGAQNERDLDDMIDSDLAQIDEAIGPDGSALANWVNGLDSCRRTAVSVTRTGGAVFVASTYSLLYDRSY
jgi:hypothetical protein